MKIDFVECLNIVGSICSLIMGSIVLFCSLTEFVLDNLSALFKFFLDL